SPSNATTPQSNPACQVRERASMGRSVTRGILWSLPRTPAGAVGARMRPYNATVERGPSHAAIITRAVRPLRRVLGRCRPISPHWSSAQAVEYAWPSAFIDESAPDDYTRTNHGGYLEVTRDHGDGSYDFKGYSLDRGQLTGVVHIADPSRFVKKDRFKGTFFL